MFVIDDSILNKVMVKLGYSETELEEILSMWGEPWRFYHNKNHLNEIIYMVLKDYHIDVFSDSKPIIGESKVLLNSAIFHDIVYNPWDDDCVNVNSSIEYYKKITSNPSEDVISVIEQASSNVRPESILSGKFWDMDNSILYRSCFQTLLDYESKILKEFQFVDYSIYKNKRIEFLSSRLGGKNNENIKSLIDYVESYRPKVGIFTGSFNPFHVGHLSILRKAEKIFDKVIVAIGVNQEKQSSCNYLKIKEALKYRQVDEYSFMTTDYIRAKSIDCDTTLIRGIRDCNDVSYEINQLRFMEDINCGDVSVVYIPCDRRYSHISSSAIRGLIDSGYSDEAKPYIV